MTDRISVVTVRAMAKAKRLQADSLDALAQGSESAGLDVVDGDALATAMDAAVLKGAQDLDDAARAELVDALK